MKKTLILALCALLIGAAAMWAVIKVVIPQWNRSAEDNTYWQVTAKLDQGGEAFAYLHTEKITAAFTGLLTNLQKKLVPAAAGPEDKTAQAFNVFNMLLKGYGLEEIAGVGFSSITLQPGLHRNRVVIFHRPGRNQGLIWNISGPAPRYLDELEMLGDNTALAFVSDYNIEKLGEWIGKQGQNMPGQGMGQGLEMMKMGLASAGIDGNRLLKSYGGRLGFLLTLDPEKRVAVPIGGSSISIPEPGIALLIKVNDSYLFDLLKGKLAGTGKAQIRDENGIKKISFPRMPMPFPLEPIIAQKGDWLIAATLASVVQGVFNPDSPRLSDSAEYKTMATKMPKRGNGFGYASPMLPRLLAQILRENKTIFPASVGLEKIAAIMARGKGFCHVWENSDTGLVYTINHSFEVFTLAEIIEAVVDIAREKAVLPEGAAAAPPVGGEAGK
ncbi:MAG: hypothetical protein NTW95_03405 [Candidatus Aminicenantes bacterium]|nr:hypothetical protein [Candidatus Aminicenantes bacterium]